MAQTRSNTQTHPAVTDGTSGDSVETKDLQPAEAPGPVGVEHKDLTAVEMCSWLQVHGQMRKPGSVVRVEPDLAAELIRQGYANPHAG
ncbi:MAG TPA: hypothetical protein VFP72_15435 [Kineosporiaceae bacterium]|nr:hypothetical protein [Kineosporiaceae bacterium]